MLGNWKSIKDQHWKTHKDMEAQSHVIKQWMGQQWHQELKTCFETNEEEDTTIQSLWGTGTAILPGTLISITGLSKNKKQNKMKQNPPKTKKQKMEKAEINNLTLL